MSEAPAGFAPLERPGPFLAVLGPLYLPTESGAPHVVGMRAQEKHLNMRGVVHGGVLAALVDTAFGIVIGHSREPRLPTVTVSLASDFLEPVRAGDWVEAHVEIQRTGKRLVFAQGNLKVGGRNVLRASGVFAIVAPAGRTPMERR